jgi:hypothetical protein
MIVTFLLTGARCREIVHLTRGMVLRISDELTCSGLLYCRGFDSFVFDKLLRERVNFLTSLIPNYLNNLVSILTG